MGHAKELPKLVDKTADELSAIIAEVAASNLSVRRISVTGGYEATRCTLLLSSTPDGFSDYLPRELQAKGRL